jgi:hypothetical protein
MNMNMGELVYFEIIRISGNRVSNPIGLVVNKGGMVYPVIRECLNLTYQYILMIDSKVRCKYSEDTIVDNVIDKIEVYIS